MDAPSVIRRVTYENARRRVHAAIDRALSDYAQLAAPDGKVSIDLDDAVALFMREDGRHS